MVHHMTLPLYPYQNDDLNFLSQWGRSGNFSEMGIGKTPTAVQLIARLEGMPCLIVCPAAVKFHWESEIRRFWPNENVPKISQYHLLRKSKKFPHIELENDILIVNYEMFRQDFTKYFANQQFKMTVFDEAHRLKNRKTQVTKCAYKLKTEYIHLITGTPITNQFDDVWSYLHLLFPDQEKSYWRFINKYGIVQNNGFGREIVGMNPKNSHKLVQTIQQFSVRRKKKEVLPDLPDKVYETIEVELKPSQRKAYNELQKYMITELENEVVQVPNIISLMTKLRQIALSTELIGGKAQSAKKDALVEILKDRILAGKKTVVMSEFRKWIDVLERDLNAKGINTVRITGAENDKQRQESIQSFQHGDAPVILCTIKAAGVGIDLTAADMLIFTDISWTDVDNRQAEDRIHRATQTKGVQIVKLFAKDTMDSTILDSTLLKALTAKQVLGEAKEQIKTLLSA